ncbi:MAG: hypothetical protein ABW089_14750 [Sedimenticola sp.]
MNKVLKREFRSYIKKNKFFHAAIIKNLYLLLGIAASAIWLVGWGFELIVVTKSLPYLKVVTILIVFGVLLSKVYFDYNILQLRNLRYRISRIKRNRNMGD